MTLLLVLAIATVVILLVVLGEQRAHAVLIKSLSSKLDALSQLSEQLQAVAALVGELEERTAPVLEQSRRRFDRGQPLTTSIVKRLSPRDVIRIVEKSYHYPFRDAFVFELDFEFDRIDEIENEQHEQKVHGRFRVAHAQPWEKYEFSVGPDEATTRDKAGTIRGILRPGMDDPLTAALEVAGGR